jgi:hypothetical protein
VVAGDLEDGRVEDYLHRQLLGLDHQLPVLLLYLQR